MPRPVSRLRVRLSLVASLLLAGACAPHAQTLGDGSPAAGIGFVRLAFTESGAALLDVTVRPGRLKPRRGTPAAAPLAPGWLAVEARTPDGALVWSEQIPDPLVVRHEFVNDHGDLQTVLVAQAQAEATVRVPAAPRLTLAFWRAPSDHADQRVSAGTLEVTF